MMTLIAHWNAQLDHARDETELAAIRSADIRVLAQLRGRTVKLSDIHREMGFLRRAALQSVGSLVARDMITVAPVPGSKRDKAVSTAEKRPALAEGSRIANPSD